MRKISLNLPKHRLQLTVTKRRDFASDEPLLPDLKLIMNIRSGNKFSRFFRHVFEHKGIKRFLGTNLALFALASAFVPTTPQQAEAAEEVFVITQDRINLITQQGVHYPIITISVTQGYKFFHPGIDFDGKTGDPITPIMSGKVANTSRSRVGYGNAILIDHGNQITSLYAHLSKIFVSEGQDVGRDTVIGAMGSTGRSTGDHLHLEIRDHGIAINPYTVLPK